MPFARSASRLAALSCVALLLAHAPGSAAQGRPGDMNGDARVDVLDVFSLINFLFAGGPAPLPSEISILLPGDVPLVMVRIPSGTFQMGSPETERGRGQEEVLHQVTLTKDFYIGKYEVTQAQWQALMGSNPAAMGGCGDFGILESNPVYCVSWTEIGAFRSELVAHLISQGYPAAWAVKFRLPTEAEWERAARAGTQTRFPFGDALDCSDLCAACDGPAPYVWWCDTSTTHGVEQKLPNAFGLHGMEGNVEEWVQDWYGAYPATPQTDPQGPASGSSRVKRGGSWNDSLLYCRPASRQIASPDFRGSWIGFRLARSL